MHTQFSTGLCKLKSLALMTARGRDAVSFLHSQLTNDIQSLPENQACLAGYCSTKGRLLSTLLAWKQREAEDEIVFIEVPAELQELFQKRLQIFIMRSKVQLQNITESMQILGIIGDAAVTKLAAWFPTIPTEPYQLIKNEAGALIRLADAEGIARYQWVLPNQLFEKIEATLTLPALSEQTWFLSEIHAGIPHISLATQDKFVPQMVNYELIGGVNFKKGCYPGQEIVARTHYLGRQKRRMVLAQVDHIEVKSGMDVFASADPGQPCGMIVNAEHNSSGGSDCLIELKTMYLNEGTVQLGTGEICRWLTLPYSLPKE